MQKNQNGGQRIYERFSRSFFKQVDKLNVKLYVNCVVILRGYIYD